MCLSRLHKVVRLGDGSAVVRSADGSERAVSLLALEGEAPEVGDWLVVHSGYAIGRADAAEAEAVAAELRAAYSAMRPG